MSITHHIADIRDEATRKGAGLIERAAKSVLISLDEHRYAQAQRRGEEIAKQMHRDGTLRARAPRKVIHLPKK